jgi:hypothetical protein
VAVGARSLTQSKRREASLKPLLKLLAVTLIVLLLFGSGWLLFCRADLLVLCFCLTEAEREDLRLGVQAGLRERGISCGSSTFVEVFRPFSSIQLLFVEEIRVLLSLAFEQ